MLEVAVGVEVETDQDRYDLRIGHHALFGGVSLHPQKRKRAFFDISTSNSFAKNHRQYRKFQ